MADNTYLPSRVQMRQDGSFAVPSGATLDVESGGTFSINGTNIVPAITSTGAIVGTVAATGSTNADAAAVAADFTIVSGGDATKGVILPAGSAGLSVTVKNNAAAVLKVYPPAGAQINALTATTGAISMAANTIADFRYQSGTQVWTHPLLPS